MSGNLCQYLEKRHILTYILEMNSLGLLFSFAFIAVVIGSGFLLSRSQKYSSESVRKFIHIGVSNWWFILIAFFDSLAYAVIGPILFIIANAIAVSTGLANVLGIKDKVRNLGLVYFPISLLILVLAGFSQTVPMWACGMGAMAMGYGDGMAALLGKRYGKRKIRGGKTLEGTLVMFVVMILVITVFSLYYGIDSLWSVTWWIFLFLIAAVAALLEAYTPYGLDNLTVPIGTALLAYWGLGIL
jgi:phytol kinase